MNVKELYKICTELVSKGHGDCPVYISETHSGEGTCHYEILDTDEWYPEEVELNHLHLYMGNLISG